MLPNDDTNVLWSLELRAGDQRVLGAVERVPDGDIRVVILDYNRKEYAQFLPFQKNVEEAARLVHRMMGEIVNGHIETLRT